MTPTEIKCMFTDLSLLTKTIITKKLCAQLSSAIAGVNADLIQHCPEKPLSLLTPLPINIFACLRLCPIENARVIIIGQDPYIKPGEAMGLSFSVPKGINVPPSLRNIYKCLLHHNLIKSEPSHGDLTNWAKQGILLLNCALTTRLKASNAHAMYWTGFTDALITEVSSESRVPLVFVLLGGFAKDKAKLIDARKHIILDWGHPSPLNTVNRKDNPLSFQFCTVFNQVNTHLMHRGDPIINWDPDLTGPTEVKKLGLLEISAPGQKTPTSEITRVYASEREHVLTGHVPANVSVDESIQQLPVEKLGPVQLPQHQLMPQPMQALPIQPPSTQKQMCYVCRPISTDDIHCYTSDTLWIFTDGGSSANGRANCKSAWAFYMCDDSTVSFATDIVPEIAIEGQVYSSSNNRGELLGILSAFQFLRDNLSKFSFESIIVVSDSEYSINSITDWIYKWQKDPVKLKTKKNTDLIAPAKDLVEFFRTKYKVTFKHINSHTDEPTDTDSELWFMWKCNDIVDRLCNKTLGRK